jgi:hypothetical protein
MRIRLGKYLIDIKRSYAGSPAKPEESTDNSSLSNIDIAAANTAKASADTGRPSAGADKSLPAAANNPTGDTPSRTGVNIGDINTIEFVSHELKGVLGSTILCVYSIRDGLLGMLNFKQRASIETTIRNLRRLESEKPVLM